MVPCASLLLCSHRQHLSAEFDLSKECAILHPFQLWGMLFCLPLSVFPSLPFFLHFYIPT